MTNQRDLAAEVEDIRKRHSSTVIHGWGGEDVGTLLAYIDLQREAIKWCLDRGAFPSKRHPGAFEVPCETDVCDAGIWEAPRHLEAALKQALGSKQ